MKGRPTHVKLLAKGLMVVCPRHTPTAAAEYRYGTGQSLTNWYEERQKFYDAHEKCRRLTCPATTRMP